MNKFYSRGARRRLPAAAALLAGLAATAPALADTGSATVIWLASPSIVVEGNGTAYNKVQPSSQNIDGKIRVELDAEVSGRVKSWEAWPVLGAGSWKAFKGTGISRSKSYNSPRPKTVNEEFFFSIPWVHYAETVIGACNARAALLRNQGLDNAAIFSQDRDVQIEVAAQVSYEMTGLDRVNPVPQEVEWPEELTVICKGTTPVAGDPTRNKPEPQRHKPKVEQAVLSVHEEDSLRGACSINLSGVIETNLPNTQVKFRYHSDDGRKSELKTVQTDHSGTVIFNHEYPLSAGGTKSGKIRMVGQHPDFASAWKSYSVQCGSPAQGYASSDPTPPTLVLNVAPYKEEMYKGFACPAQVSMDGRIKASDAYEGRAIFIARQQGVAEPQSQVDEQNFDIVQGQHWAVAFSPDLRWSNVPLVGGNPPKQTMKLTFQVSRHHKVVASVEKTLVLSCRKVQTSGVGGQAPGGVSSGKPKPTHSQQQTVPAQPQDAPLVIMPVKIK